MNRDLLRGFLQIGLFVAVSGFVLALLQSPDSPEFVVSLCSGLIGLLLIIGVVLIIRLSR